MDCGAGKPGNDVSMREVDIRAGSTERFASVLSAGERDEVDAALARIRVALGGRRLVQRLPPGEMRDRFLATRHYEHEADVLEGLLA